MNKGLLDTDILSEFRRGRNEKVARRSTDYLSVHGRLTFSSLTVMEVIRGHRHAEARTRLDEFRTLVLTAEVLDFDAEAADLAGLIAGDLLRAGRPIGLCDPMIAAVAIRNGLELITGNTAHYSRLRDFGFPLTLVNWRV